MFTTYDKEFEPTNKFSVPELEDSNTVSVGVADSLEDRAGRLLVVTQRYEDENYLDNIKRVKTDLSIDQLLNPKLSLGSFEQRLYSSDKEEFLSNGLLIDGDQIRSNNGGVFIDKYSWNSIPIVAKELCGYTGSARLIIADKESNLPIFSSPEIKLYRNSNLDTNVEISQLARLRNSHPMILFGLLRVAKLYSDEVGIKDWVATIDKRVFSLLNKRICFDIKQIGDEVNYLGSISVPSYINIKNSIESIRRSNPTAARFLDGDNNVDGFEWYRGV